MPLLTMLALAGAAATCPNMEGVWRQGAGARVLVMRQQGCRLSGTVAEPANQILEVSGFWTGAGWTMAATRRGVCATTAWGSIRADGSDTMLVNVRGSDGLCGPNGAPGAGPTEFDATMTYRRFVPGP
jgi:hypothetical protein